MSRFRSVLLASALVLPVGERLGAQTNGGVERLGWMAGCWEIRTATRVVEEYWMPPRGGTMLGMARTVVGDSLREFESTMIRARGGRLGYEANPSGQQSTTFPAVVASADSVVFELPAHDFPQRIGYTRRGPDSLVAWIEGTRNGRFRRIPYPFVRATCPS